MREKKQSDLLDLHPEVLGRWSVAMSPNYQRLTAVEWMLRQEKTSKPNPEIELYFQAPV